MQPETMTAEERVWAAINLQECDQVPVDFPLSWFTARHAGITMAEFANDCEANVAATYKTFEDLGGFDVVPLLTFSPVLVVGMLPMKKRFPEKIYLPILSFNLTSRN